MNERRPDPSVVLGGLKDFQRRTVDHVFQRFYEDTHPCRRFLVADEVGLGKTMVARGVIARTIERLWSQIERIDVIYICSNADIARQNVRRLVQAVPDQKVCSVASRINLLPVTIENLKGNRVNFVALTPGTSFSLRSSMGTWRERRLLYWMLHEAWDFGRLAGPKNVLQGGAGRERFRRNLKRFDRSKIDPTLHEGYLRALASHDRHRALEDRQGLRERFEALCEEVGFATARMRSRIPKHIRAEQADLIGDLRGVLAASCLNALEPDLIILDEFQRFRHLLHGDSEEGKLARGLFNFTDEEEGAEAKVLLLSATPYKMYTLHDEDEEDHYREFLQTVEFLSERQGSDIGPLLKRFRHALYRLGQEGPGALEELREVKAALEARLRRVMVRTERLSVGDDRSGMLSQKEVPCLDLEVEDVGSLLGMEEVASAVGHGDLLEYWKAAPYLLNFMTDNYALKRNFQESLELEDRRNAVQKTLKQHGGLVLRREDWESYQRLDPRSSRMRWLLEDVVEKGAWKLLWVPPSLPPYQLEGPFAELSGFTKRLVFSSWRVVPRAIAAMVSYEAERRIFAGYEENPRNTSEARTRRARLLEFRIRGEYHAGMPVLGLLYPSTTLARKVDPRELASRVSSEDGANGELPTLEQVLRAAVRRIEVLLEPVLARRSQGDGPADESWYWAGPILLDLEHDRSATRGWLEQEDLADAWRGHEAEAPAGEEQSDRWADHVAVALSMARGETSLGPPPSDLAQVLAFQALAGPGSSSLRALESVLGEAPGNELRGEAARLAWALRSLFNGQEATALIRGLLPGEDEAYWRKVLRYAAIGGLSALLEEHVHLLKDSLGIRQLPIEEAAHEAVETCIEALTLRTVALGVDEIESDGTGLELHRNALRMRAHIAARFGDEASVEERAVVRAGNLRTAFNSPFWPFVLATTSVGQEGLDFHTWCHAVVHWNLPGNPVDLEQRDGRVHRYKGHAVRRNLARRHGRQDPTDGNGHGDLWDRLFEEKAVADRGEGDSELVPYWIYPVQDGATIERHVPALPLSRDVVHLDSLRRSLALYRMVFGQPHQEDLVGYLAQHLERDEIEQVREELRIDLSPRLETTQGGDDHYE